MSFIKFNWFLISGIILEVIVWILTPGSSIISGVSGVSGIIAVVLCSQKKLSQYFFSFLQLFTYSWLAYCERLYGELLENLFYFITMLFGVWYWSKGYKDEILPKELSLKFNLGVFIFTVLGILGLWIFLRSTDDTQPFLDSVTTVPAFVAQVLLMTKYRENWIYWLIIDIFSIFMWTEAGNYCMVAQFIFWSINCIYGWVLWNSKRSH